MRASKYRWLPVKAERLPVGLGHADGLLKLSDAPAPETLKRHVVHVQRVSHYEYVVEYVYPDEPPRHRD